MRYPAIIEGGEDDYGIWFPDLPGIVAMGDTLEEAIRNAQAALDDYAIEAERDGMSFMPPSSPATIEVPPGCTLTTIQLVRETPERSALP